MSFVDWKAGMRITASRLRAITPDLKTWTPVWTTSTGNNTPSFGNATVIAEYSEFGRLCIGRLDITFGSTTNFGGGTTADNWRFSVPVTASSASTICGWGEVQDTSATIASRLGFRCRLTTTTTMELETASGRVDGTAVTNTGLMDSLSPWTWANTDTVKLFFQYPTAS